MTYITSDTLNKLPAAVSWRPLFIMFKRKQPLMFLTKTCVFMKTIRIHLFNFTSNSLKLRQRAGLTLEIWRTHEGTSASETGLRLLAHQTQLWPQQTSQSDS